MTQTEADRARALEFGYQIMGTTMFVGLIKRPESNEMQEIWWLEDVKDYSDEAMKIRFNRVEKIRSALAGDKWLPIESAPRDGSRVVLWCDQWTGPSTGQFYGQFWALDSSIREFKYQPTHWQPLPPEPGGDKQPVKQKDIP